MADHWERAHLGGDYRADILAIEAEARAESSAEMERALALVYAEGYASPAPVAVAKVCDETLDRSGALLGRIRTAAASLRAALGDSR